MSLGREATIIPVNRDGSVTEKKHTHTNDRGRMFLMFYGFTVDINYKATLRKVREVCFVRGNP